MVILKNSLRECREAAHINQKELAAHNIYCPVHWPIPEQVKPAMDKDSEYIYSHVLSLICDQRYDLEDMVGIVDIANKY